jgi:4-diphosphocytidyl-2-C-methyl-D-erythritol kinase
MEMTYEWAWHPAPGKLNLFLHVLGRRDDGYHELQTAFRLIDRQDRVGIRVRSDGAVVRHAPLPGIAPQDDLCVRAAQLLKAASGTALGADVALEKNLPLGGGLGGGSSDAATVLLVLNRLWRAHLSRAALMRLGARLGADVPLFVFGENALGEGIGERLTALALPEAWYLVLVPPVSVATASIFGDNALTRNTKAIKIPPFFRGLGGNDLEAVAVRRHPEIGAHLDWLRIRRRDARMSGSGACVFAEFDREAQARALLAELPGGMRGFVARGLEHHPLRHWAN